MKLVTPPTMFELVHATSQRVAEALKDETHEVCILALASVAGTFVGAHKDPGTALENFMRTFGEMAGGAAKDFGNGGFKMQMMALHEGGKK